MNDKKKALGAAATGAAAGMGTSASIGGMGLVGSGVGLSIGMLPVTLIGVTVGLAGFGLYKAFSNSSKK